MEALEELMGDAHIIKGKRTKRQRLQSPIPFSIANYDSPGGGAEGENNACSPTELAESATTEEDEEDMVANCLILLAQGGSPETKSSKPETNFHDHGGIAIATGFRYTSKRFLEAPNSGNNGGKVGIYVYQCKTCDRTFPSFQALGGHRASHKRPKPAPVEVRRKTTMLLTDDELGGGEEQEEGEIKDHHHLSPSLSLQLVNNRPNGNLKSSPKVHECSICGAEFVSGQALGGHMRRHRIPGGTNTALSLSPLSPIIGCEYEDREAKKQRNVLSLGPLSPVANEAEDREAKKQRNVLLLGPLSPVANESEDREAKKQRNVLLLGPLSPVANESEDREAKKQRNVVLLGPLSPVANESEDREAKKQRNGLTLSPLSAIGGDPEDQETDKQRIVLSLDLDLNLPAPLEDQVGESKFAFASKEQSQQQQQSPLVLSAGPALVDCQY